MKNELLQVETACLSAILFIARATWRDFVAEELRSVLFASQEAHLSTAAHIKSLLRPSNSADAISDLSYFLTDSDDSGLASLKVWFRSFNLVRSPIPLLLTRVPLCFNILQFSRLTGDSIVSTKTFSFFFLDSYPDLVNFLCDYLPNTRWFVHPYLRMCSYELFFSTFPCTLIWWWSFYPDPRPLACPNRLWRISSPFRSNISL